MVNPRKSKSQTTSRRKPSLAQVRKTLARARKTPADAQKAQKAQNAQKAQRVRTETRTARPATTRRRWNIKRRIILLFPAIIIVAFCVFFVIKTKSVPRIENYSIIHDPKFGGVYITSGINDFNNLGFQYGDSVDVKFSNGYELKDIPYYNGYYVEMDEPLLIAYPGYEYIKVGINYGADLWFTADLTEEDTASIYLNRREKYLDIQNARNIQYSDVQGSTPDVVFANFRNVKVGKIKEGILYRSASPVDNSHNRAPIVDKLISAAGVNYIINLSDNETELAAHINQSDFNSPYFLSLYNREQVLPLDMDAQFKSTNFEQKLVQGLTAMAENPGPYLIHCVEGKDRTGYVLMVIEALLGASYEEIVDDYMDTYDNYYDINIESDKERYDTIKETNIDVMLHHIIGDDAGKRKLTEIDSFANYANDYLHSIGLCGDTTKQLIENLRY